MSYTSRRLAPLAIASFVIASVVACSSAAAPSTAPSGSPSPSNGASDAPSPSQAGGAVDHATGATDVLLRYEEAGGFVMAGFAASQVPHFTLYGDGTVIFRNPMVQAPAQQGSVMTFNPMRTAKLSEEQIQELLVAALGDGGLAAARPNYTNDMVADASTAIFTINAGGIDKTVSVYALGLEMDGQADAAARSAFKKLADRLTDFDQGGSIASDVYEPTAYLATLIESPGMVAPDVRPWPWKELTVADFKPAEDPNGLQFPNRVMTADQIDLLGVEGYEGGFQGLPITGTDDKLYTLSLRPLLPDDES